ncbi:MAG: 4Fe-4S dicluster domain-containing protein, partial [Bacillota bacterium]
MFRRYEGNEIINTFDCCFDWFGNCLAACRQPYVSTIIIGESKMNHKYLKNVATLKLESEKCTGCGMCANVCPHGVFAMEMKKAKIVDLDSCMECGACEKNCPFA